MSTKNDINWMANYHALKEYIRVRGHLPDKHVVENRALLSWAKYNHKKIKEGTLDSEKTQLFNDLMAMRSTEHTGGRRKREVPPCLPGCDVFFLTNTEKYHLSVMDALCLYNKYNKYPLQMMDASQHLM